MPAKAAKPTFAATILITMPPLAREATTGTCIFVQPPNTTAYTQSEIGQSQQIPNFFILCTPVVASAQTNFCLQIIQSGQTKNKM